MFKLFVFSFLLPIFLFAKNPPSQFKEICSWESPFRNRVEKFLLENETSISKISSTAEGKIILGTPLLYGWMDVAHMSDSDMPKKSLDVLQRADYRVFYPVFHGENLVTVIHSSASISKENKITSDNKLSTRKIDGLLGGVITQFYQLPTGAPKSICAYRQVMIPYRNGQWSVPISFIYYTQDRLQKVIPTQAFQTPKGEKLEPGKIYAESAILKTMQSLWQTNRR